MNKFKIIAMLAYAGIVWYMCKDNPTPKMSDLFIVAGIVTNMSRLTT